MEGEQLELALKNMKVSQDEHVSEAQLEWVTKSIVYQMDAGYKINRMWSWGISLWYLTDYMSALHLKTFKIIVKIIFTIYLLSFSFSKRNVMATCISKSIAYIYKWMVTCFVHPVGLLLFTHKKLAMNWFCTSWPITFFVYKQNQLYSIFIFEKNPFNRCM